MADQSTSSDEVDAGLHLTDITGLKGIYHLSQGIDLYQAVTKMERVLRHNRLSIRSKMTLSIDLMEWYGQLGWPDRAQGVARVMGERSAATVGECDVWTLGMRRLELLWMCLSGYEHLAGTRYRQLIKEMEKVLGKNHPQVWFAKRDSALPYRRSGSYATAIKIYTMLIEDITEICGNESPWLTQIREHLADTLSCHGEWERSTNEYRLILDADPVPQSKATAIERKISLNTYCMSHTSAQCHPLQSLCDKMLSRL